MHVCFSTQVRHSGAAFLDIIRAVRGSSSASPSTVLSSAVAATSSATVLHSTSSTAAFATISPTPASLLAELRTMMPAFTFSDWLADIVLDLRALLTTHRGDSRVTVPLFKAIDVLLTHNIWDAWDQR
jgi:hypothetical protein